MMRSVSYGFPEVVIDPGTERLVKIDLHEPFRAQKLMMVGLWDVVRGHFVLKRSRLGRLDREDVVCSSTRVYKGRRGKRRWFRAGKTTVEFRGDSKRKAFVREYLPSSVIYVPTEPLHFVELRNLFVGTEAQMFGGASAEWFGPAVLGNGLILPTAEQSMSLLLQNIGDVQIRVRAMVLGVGR